LGHIFHIFAHADETANEREDPGLVAPDQFLERVPLASLAASNKFSVDIARLSAG
jgi:hypothetical protein